MNKLMDSITQHRHLIVISICSGLFVVLLQAFVSQFIPNKSKGSIAMKIEDISASIIPLQSSDTQNQFMSILTEKEITDFGRVGVVEDLTILSRIPKQELYLDKLFNPLDGSVAPSNSKISVEKQMLIRMNDVHNYTVSLCTSNSQSCTLTLVSRSSETIPVRAQFKSLDDSRGILLLHYTPYQGSYKGSFGAQPLKLSIRAM